MDLEHRVGLALEQNAPLEAYHASILFNNAALSNPARFPAQAVAQERARIHDEFVKKWFRNVVTKTFGKEISCDAEEPPFQFTLLAIGGYGRNELNPNSDIDLKLVIDEPALQGNPLIEMAAHEGIYNFEKEYGFPIELSCHTLHDLDELKGAGLNTFLDMRHLWGEQRLTRKIREMLNVTYDPADLFLHNLQAHANLAKTHGDLDDFTEFNIKNGAGGLRVFHIARYLESLPTIQYTTDEMLEEGPFSLKAQQTRTTQVSEHTERAFSTLMQIRSWLNIRRAKEQKKQRDILRPEDLEALSPKMRQALATARHAIASYFEQTKRKKLALGLQVPRGEYSFTMTNEGLKQSEPMNNKQNERGHRLLNLAQERQIPLHPEAIEQLATLNPSPLLFEGLKSEQPYAPIAKVLHQNGGLARVIPGFERLYGITLKDAQERTMTAAGKAIQRLERAERIIEHEGLTADDRAMIRFTSLIADIPENPTIKNAGNPLSEYPGLEKERGRDILFLLKERETLIEKAKQGLNDEATVNDLAAVSETPERLHLLYMFTQIDQGETPHFPQYVRGNIGELVKKTKMKLRGQETQHLTRDMLSETGEAIYKDLGPDFNSSRYAESHLHTWISTLERVQKTGQPVVKRFNMSWPLFGIAAPNKNGLLAALTGTFYTEKANLRQAHAYTLSRHGLVLDFFETDALTEEKEIEVAEKLAQQASNPTYPSIDPRTILQPLDGKAKVTQRVGANYYTLEYHATQDSPGIVYALTRALSDTLQASIWGLNAHAKPKGAVEDRVFFTLAQQRNPEEIEQEFKQVTGIH